MRRVATVLAAAVLIVCFALPAQAAGPGEVSQSLDVQQGLEFGSGRTSAFGVITVMQIGALRLAPDLRSIDPTPSSMQVLPAVGILSSIERTGGATSPLNLEFQVSPANRAALREYLANPSTTVVTFSFRSYAFDSAQQRWYESYAPQADGTLHGRLAPIGGFPLVLDSIPSPAPRTTYGVKMQIVPGQAAETLILSSSASSRVSTPWGTTPVTPTPGPATRPDLAGSRIQTAGDPKIYLVDSDGTKRWIPDQATYWNLFRDATGIKSVDVSTVSSGPELTSGAYLAWDGVAGTPIYLVTNGQKRHIASPSVFDKFWFNWSRVKTVAKSTLDALPNGPDLA